MKKKKQRYLPYALAMSGVLWNIETTIMHMVIKK